MDNKFITTGSTVFFNGIDGFKHTSDDMVLMVDRGHGFDFVMTVDYGCNKVMHVVRRPKAELIEYALTTAPAIALGRFLTPEFAEEIGLTIADLHTLAPLAELLPEKQAYQRVIYDAYLTNGSFTLTEEQRGTAYEAYKAARPEKRKQRKEART